MSQWVDVTEECDVPVFTGQYKDHCEIWHNGNRLFIVGNELVQGYRLRKIRVDHLLRVNDLWAFTVERREP